MNYKNSQQRHNSLLLLGPSGSGKTATVKVLCNELKLELIEWESRDQYEVFFEETGEQSVKEIPQAS